MDIFDAICEATKEANSFENHPVKELSLEEQILYLNGIALVMNADGNIDENQKEYVRILIKSFEMDESCLDDMVAFAQSPDKDTIQAFFRTFRRKPIAQLFLFDAYMMSHRDDQLHEKEIAVIDKMAEQLEVLKGIKRNIFDMFCHIKNKDWEESSVFFNTRFLDSKHFAHLLDYFEITLSECFEDGAAVTKNRLICKVNDTFFENIEWGDLSYEDTEIDNEYRYITNRSVQFRLTHGLALTWLQSLWDSKELRCSGETIYIRGVKTEYAFSELIKCFSFHQENRLISLVSINDEFKIVDDRCLFELFLELNDISINDFLEIWFGKYDFGGSIEANIPLCNSEPVYAITKNHDRFVNGYPNAITDIKNETVNVRWCVHCTDDGIKKLCTDTDERFDTFKLSEFLLDFGLLLVK